MQHTLQLLTPYPCGHWSRARPGRNLLGRNRNGHTMLAVHSTTTQCTQPETGKHQLHAQAGEHTVAAAPQPGQQHTNSAQFNHPGPAGGWDLHEGAVSVCRRNEPPLGQPEDANCGCCCSDTARSRAGWQSLSVLRAVPGPTVPPPHTPRPGRRCAGGPAPAIMGADVRRRRARSSHSRGRQSLPQRCHPNAATKTTGGWLQLLAGPPPSSARPGARRGRP